MRYAYSIERRYRTAPGGELFTDVLHTGTTVAISVEHATANAWYQAAVAKRRRNISKFYMEWHDRQDYRCRVWEKGYDT